MAKRSYFLRSVSLVLLIALCLTAVGSVQASQNSFKSVAKPGTAGAGKISYSRSDIPSRDASFPLNKIRDYQAGTEIGMKKGGFQMQKGARKVNASPANRSHLVSSLKDRFALSPSRNSTFVSGTGTVVSMDIEGGFFGIIADDGTHYIPSNLPASCRFDKLRVKFSGLAGNEAPTAYMWGSPLRILSASPLGAEITASGTIEYIDLEGGFYGIVTTGGDRYLPLNLLEELEVDGLQVTFTARTAPDTNTIAMWGTPVLLISIERKAGPVPDQATSPTGQWTLAGMAKGDAITPVIQGSVITAEFTGDGRVSGTSGCNLYSAPFEIEGTTIAIGPAISTMMYCNDITKGIMKQESTYLQLLEDAASWEIRGENLVILDESGRVALVFSPGIADEPDAEEPLVEFWRTGGFAGMNDHLVIYPDGTVSLTRKEYSSSFSLEEPDLEALVALFEESGFMNLAPQYPAPPGSADLFIYQICWQGKTVVAEDTMIPEGLQEIIGVLTALVVENAPDDVMIPLGH